jgi:hypothetical protein
MISKFLRPEACRLSREMKHRRGSWLLPHPRLIGAAKAGSPGDAPHDKKFS